MKNHSIKKAARHNDHVMMMTAFHAWFQGWHPMMVNGGETKPVEGDPRFNIALSAFKAGWNLRGSHGKGKPKI